MAEQQVHRKSKKSNRNSSLFKICGFALALTILIGGCGVNPTEETIIASLVSNTSSSTTTPPETTPTETQPPSSTPPPTITPTSSTTPTATPTLHPMHILAARQTPYPGSAINIEITLDAGINYSRYIAWYESEGLKIYGLLTVPLGEMPPTGWPAIVFNHGYIPPEQYRSTERYIAYVDQLARNGYIVYRIDYRGHDRSDGDPNGAYGDPGYTVDVLNAVTALQNFPQADPNRIGMWGHSMGGFLTLRAMVISKEIKAGVIWAGVVASYPDLICCWRRATPGVPTRTLNPDFRSSWRSRWYDLYSSPDENPEFWLGISANSYLSDISGPIQLHHGTSDTSVPLAFSQTLYAKMMQMGLPVEYYEYEGDNHNLSNYFSLAMQRTLAFYEQYLKNAQ